MGNTTKNSHHLKFKCVPELFTTCSNSWLELWIFNTVYILLEQQYLKIVSGLDDLIHIKRGEWILCERETFQSFQTHSHIHSTEELLVWELSYIDSIWNIDKVKILVPNRRVTGVTAVFLAAVSVFVQTSSSSSRNIQTSFLFPVNFKY